MYQPLADLLRPTTLDEVYGQEHILGQGAILRRLIDSGKIPNMVFYGPSGTGKTTVANIIAQQTNRTLYKLNATTASTADIKQIVAELDGFMAPNGVLLYLDEIQSFNKKQQQTLLEYIEKGSIRGVDRDLVLFNPGSLGEIFNGSFGNLSVSDNGFLFSHGEYRNIAKSK